MAEQTCSPQDGQEAKKKKGVRVPLKDIPPTAPLSKLYSTRPHLLKVVPHPVAEIQGFNTWAFGGPFKTQTTV